MRRRRRGDLVHFFGREHKLHWHLLFDVSSATALNLWQGVEVNQAQSKVGPNTQARLSPTQERA